MLSLAQLSSQIVPVIIAVILSLGVGAGLVLVISWSRTNGAVSKARQIITDAKEKLIARAAARRLRPRKRPSGAATKWKTR